MRSLTVSILFSFLFLSAESVARDRIILSAFATNYLKSEELENLDERETDIFLESVMQNTHRIINDMIGKMSEGETLFVYVNDLTVPEQVVSHLSRRYRGRVVPIALEGDLLRIELEYYDYVFLTQPDCSEEQLKLTRDLVLRLWKRSGAIIIDSIFMHKMEVRLGTDGLFAHRIEIGLPYAIGRDKPLNKAYLTPCTESLRYTFFSGEIDETDETERNPALEEEIRSHLSQLRQEYGECC